MVASDRPPATRESLRTRSAVPMVGRDADRATLHTALLEGTRLVTLTGPAGVGKTRLADDIAESVAADLGGRALMVRLEHAQNALALSDAVEVATNEAGGEHGEEVLEVLASLGPTLLVLDPSDRWIEDRAALDAISGWLDGCPELVVLLVGRGRSHLPGERVVELSVLDEGSALALFMQFGALHRPGFELKTDEDQAAARAITSSLDHLPLAIELASSRLAVMTPQALLHRLTNRWEVLKKGGAAGQRHGTLDAAISWSLELLEPGARALFEDATIFRGGFSVEVAEAVLPAPAGSSVIDGLLHLRERSLLMVEEPIAGEVRLRMLESVRLVAERGLDPRRSQRLEEAHALAYVTAAESWARDVELLGAAEARARLGLEHDNLAIVVERILGRGTVSARAADRALRVLAALGAVSSREGASALLRAHLETAISVAQGSGADPRLLARALALRGTLRAAEGRTKDGERDLAEALVLANHSGEQAIEARVLVASASVSASAGRRPEARALLGRARQIAEASQDRTLSSRTSLAEAFLDLEDGNLGAARLGLDEALAQARRSDDRALRAEAEHGLGRLYLLEGIPEGATSHLKEALGLADTLHDLSLSAEASMLLALCEAQLGQDPLPSLERSLAAARRSGQPLLAARASALLALAFFGRGELGEARALLREARPFFTRFDADLAAAALLVLSDIEHAAGTPDPALLVEARKRAPRDAVIASRLAAGAVAGPVLGIGILLGKPAAPAAPTAGRVVLELGPEGSSFRIDGGETVDLSRRKPLRRLLDHLAERPTDAVPWDALLNVGWPGEKMRADAGAHRVRVAISTLRKMGLTGLLMTDEEGYRLKRGVEVKRSPAL